MQNRLHRHLILWYFGLTMAVSLLLLVPHLLLGVILTPSFSLTQFGPAAALFLFSFLRGSSVPLRSAFARFRVEKLLSWGIIAVSATGIILFVCGKLLSLWGIPFTHWGGQTGFYSMEGLAMLICCAGEEVGWRGFLLPELCKSRSLFVSSLIVGLFWGIWHLNFTEGLLGFILFTVSIMMNSIFIAWFFQRSGGNLFVTVLEHLSFNLFSHLFLWNRFGIKGYIVEIVLYGFVDFMLVCFDWELFFSRPQNSGTSSSATLSARA